MAYFIVGLGVLIICFIIYGFLFVSPSLSFNTCLTVKCMQPWGQKAFAGPEGWIFFRRDLYSILRPWWFLHKNAGTISSLNDSLKKSGIYLFVVPVPDKEAIIQKYLPVSIDQVSRQRLHFINVLKQKHVNVIDLTLPYNSYNGKDSLYLKKDTHWDQKGIMLAAEIISAEIASTLGSKCKYAYSIKDTNVSEQGDLSKIIGDPAYYQRECKMIRMEDGSPFKDSPMSDIMIFGDSYTMFNRTLNAGIGAHIAYYTKQPTRTYPSLSAHIDGPSQLRYLLNGCKKKPKVVVWVFTSRFLCEKMK